MRHKAPDLLSGSYFFSCSFSPLSDCHYRIETFSHWRKQKIYAAFFRRGDNRFCWDDPGRPFPIASNKVFGQNLLPNYFPISSPPLSPPGYKMFSYSTREPIDRLFTKDFPMNMNNFLKIHKSILVYR